VLQAVLISLSQAFEPVGRYNTVNIPFLQTNITVEIRPSGGYPPLGLISTVMLVWRKGNINRTVTVL